MSDLMVPSQPWFRRALTVIGVVVVLWDLAGRIIRGSVPAWAAACLLVAVIAWVVCVLLPARHRRIGVALFALMIGGGGLAATSTDAVGIIPILVAVLWLARDVDRPLWAPAVGVVAGMALILVGDLIVPFASLGLLSIAAGLVVAFFGGLSRRQFLVAEARSRQLVGEQARADVLAARQQIAHDIHDVLAHSLGGLVIQLDAVDALIEAGDTKAAAARARDARDLAADGLVEARRAVAALSEVAAEGRVDGDELLDGLAALLSVHRSLGGTVDFDESGARTSVPAPLAAALRRALQESLTNARKHAAGEPVTVRLAWKSGTVGLSIANRVIAGQADAEGGGHGLVGMRDRFAALAGGSATAEPEAGAFVVRVGGDTA